MSEDGRRLRRLYASAALDAKDKAALARAIAMLEAADRQDDDTRPVAPDKERPR